MGNKYDKETQEILDEIAEEESQDSAEEAVEEKEEESEEEASEEESPAEEEKEEVEDEPSEDEDEDSDDDEEEPSVNPYQDNQPKMSVAKHQKKKKNWEKRLLEREEKIRELETKVKTYENQGADSKIKELSETYGFDTEFVKGVVEAVRGAVPDVSEDLKAFREQQVKLSQDSLYSDDFEQNINPIIYNDYPDVSQSQVNKIKQELRKLKFTKELSQVPLDYIFIRHKSKFDSILNPNKKKTAEKSRAGAGSRDKIIDYDNITEDDIANMSDKEFDKYSETMAKKTKRLVIT